MPVLIAALATHVQFIEETERSLHDAIMIVRRAIKNDAVVAGGGAIEVRGALSCPRIQCVRACYLHSVT